MANICVLCERAGVEIVGTTWLGSSNFEVCKDCFEIVVETRCKIHSLPLSRYNLLKPKSNSSSGIVFPTVCPNCKKRDTISRGFGGDGYAGCSYCLKAVESMENI